MGVALKDGTIHERAGVAFVGVTANVLLIRVVAARKFPFEAGGEARTAATSQTGVEHGLDDLLGGHLGENLTQSGIAVLCDVVVDLLGIDNAAVAQRDTLLLLIESGFVQGFDGVVLDGLLIQKTGDDTTLVEMLLNDLGDILDLDHGVEGALGIDDHDRTQRAQTEAAGGDDVDFLLKAFLDQLFLELLGNL